MSIAVPPGVLPGQTLAVKVPDGRELHVVVPKDAGQEPLEATGSRWKCGMCATNRTKGPMVQSYGAMEHERKQHIMEI